jgi:dTMP kinase
MKLGNVMNKQNQLKFITIEGVDGAGKSTYIPFIKNFLEARGEEVVLTREPGGSDLGLRDIILNKEMCTMAETLLLFADRAEHIDKIINPALAAGKWVICDRFTDSTLTYQSVGKNFPEQKIRLLETLVQEEIKPSLTFIFTVPLEISKQRLAQTGKIPDKFERESDEFFIKINQAYKNIFKKEKHRCKLVDSSRTIEETNEQVLLYLEEFYRQMAPQRQTRLKF